MKYRLYHTEQNVYAGKHDLPYLRVTTSGKVERQLPYGKWDDEIIEYLCAEKGLKGLGELLDYLKPSITGNLNLVRVEPIEEQQ